MKLHAHDFPYVLQRNVEEIQISQRQRAAFCDIERRLLPSHHLETATRHNVLFALGITWMSKSPSAYSRYSPFRYSATRTASHETVTRGRDLKHVFRMRSVPSFDIFAVFSSARVQTAVGERVKTTKILGNTRTCYLTRSPICFSCLRLLSVRSSKLRRDAQSVLQDILLGFGSSVL